MNETAEINDYEQLAQRVSRTVERENRRRRRAIRFFFVLLLVPLAAAVMILLKGMTDTEWVRENARVAVEPDLKAARKTADEIDEVLPQVHEAVSKVEETNQRIEVVEHRQAEGFEVQQASIISLQEQLRVTNNQVSELAQIPMATRDPRVDELFERVGGMERELESIRQYLRRMTDRGAVRESEDFEHRLRVIEEKFRIVR